MRQIRFIFLAIFFISTSFHFPGKKKKPDPFIFATYLGEGASGLHLYFSEDGFKWQSLKGGKSVIKPGVGDYLMQQPHVSQTPDGIYHLVWATGKNRKDIGYAWSKNLFEWSVQRLIPVMEKDTLVLNSWSPELLYDESSQKFMLYWASAVPGKFKETEKQNDSLKSGYKYNHRIYRKFSTDLQTWTDTELFFNPEFNCSDPNICSDSGRIMMFYQDATNMNKNVQQNIKMSTSNSLIGPFSGTPLLIGKRLGIGGPSGIRIDSQYVVYFQRQMARKMGAVITKNFTKWKDISDSLSFPKGVQQGSIFRVPEKTLDKLKSL